MADDLYVLWSPCPKDKPSNILLFDVVQTSHCHMWNNFCPLLEKTSDGRQLAYLLASKLLSLHILMQAQKVSVDG